MSTKTLDLTQIIPGATSQQVFDAFTQADLLALWWWPHIADTTYAVDARTGGAYEIRSQMAGIGLRGQFVILQPPSHIRLTWNWMNDGVSEFEEVIGLHIEPADNGTTLALTHYLSPQAGDGVSLHQGWKDVLGRLAKLWGKPLTQC